MNGAYDDERLAVAQRAYNEVMSDLVGGPPRMKISAKV